MPSFVIHPGHVLDSLRAMPEKSVHCVVTSPPYWGLRDYGLPPSPWGDGWSGCLGLEPDPRDFVKHIVEVFAEVWRVLRDDGTLWLNFGDSYARTGGKGSHRGATSILKDRKIASEQLMRNGVPDVWALQSKSLIGIPWRVAFAMAESSWILRSEVIWHKRSAMPESVGDRPTRAHEHIFLFAKQSKYYFDSLGASEPASANSRPRGSGKGKKNTTRAEGGKNNDSFNAARPGLVEMRNMRTVWTLSTEMLKEKHFAAFPSKLVERCLKAGISIGGVCEACGAPRHRVIESERVPTRPGGASKCHNPRPSQHDESPYLDHTGAVVGNRDPERHVTKKTTVGWRHGCECAGPAGIARPVVLDPFAGSGTTLLVAMAMGCDAVGLELNPAYIEIAKRRINQRLGLLVNA